MDKFKKEVKELSTADLLLILEDQVDLYSDEELKILRDELSSRPENALELEAEEQARKEKIEAEAAQRAEREREVQRQKQAFENRINSLKARGYECYYEYTTLSLVDDDGGGLTTSQVTRLLNDYALDGWKLVSAYTNELGHNSTSGGIGGFSTGTNSTIDQHILILERFVRI
ncbi:MAG: hypothetical protein IJ447_07120 [Clostridia bacterium]|nr:hypothetical protein [Clostridia bacterium]